MAVRASFENSNEAKSEEEGGRGELKRECLDGRGSFRI